MLHYNPQHISSSTLNIFRGQIALLQPVVSTLSVNSRTVCRSTLNRHTVWLFTESDDTRGCNNTICPPEDEQGAAGNMLRIIM